MIDVLFVVLFVAGLAAGFFHGTFRLAAVLVSYYLSVVLASALFRLLGGFFMTKLGSSQDVAMYTAFALIMMVSFIALAAYGVYTVRDFKLPGQLMYLDRISGVFISLVVTSLFLGLLGILLWNLMIVKGAENIDLPIMRMLGNSVRNSFFLQYFAVHILPRAYNFAGPILPDSARFIFAVGAT